MSELELPPVVVEPIIVPKTYEPVTVLIPRVIGSMKPVGRDQWNEQQRFKFRGVEDIMAALKPALAEHGVFWVPTVVERRDSERTTSGGKPMFVVLLRVLFRFYGPAGDYVEAEGWGEGTDMGDKATNKAMTGAMKYVVTQVFAVGDESSDADHSAPPETQGKAEAPTWGEWGWADEASASAEHQRVALRAKNLPEVVDREGLQAFQREHGWPMPKHLLDQFEAMVADAERVHATITGEPGRPFDEPTVQEPTSPEDTPSSPVPKQEPEAGTACREGWEGEEDCPDHQNAHECKWQFLHEGPDHVCSCGSVLVGVAS